ncbi:MAG: prolipoprotein diacylglyceryl transferase [Proteobacteria bacterium]|nr:prolipoprotein diacylglyceryl transferase [Pseudomonadota bacterium]
MFPEIFRIGSLAVHTYGLFIAIGIILALYFIKIECKKSALDSQKIIDILFWAIWIGIIGSRVFYVIYFPDEFLKDPMEFFRIWKGGLVFHGGLLFAIPFVIFSFKKERIPILTCLDIIVVFIPLAHFFGRLGCFFAGCCYGKVCELPWAVKFTNPLTLAPKNIPLHPTQLYEAFSNLSLFFILFLLRKKIKVEGVLLSLYLIGYGIIRFFIEFLRGDLRDVYLGYSTAQWISIFFVITGIILIFYMYIFRKRMKNY